MKKMYSTRNIALLLGVTALTASTFALSACSTKQEETSTVETLVEASTEAAAETVKANTEAAAENSSESSSEAAAETLEASTEAAAENSSEAGTEAAAETLEANTEAAETTSSTSASVIAESLPENYPGDAPVKAIGGFYFEGEQPAMENVNGDVHEELLFLNYDENCLILDATDGYPADTSAITEPVPAIAYVSQASTMSLPPQTNPELILVCTDGGCTDSFPYYVTITDNTVNSDNGNHVLTSSRGDRFVTSDQTEIIPFRTKQVVVIDAITEGTDCLVWLDNDMIASKIMVFAD